MTLCLFVRVRVCVQAIRGGGPLYGLVISWTVKLHKAPAKVQFTESTQSPGQLLL